MSADWKVGDKALCIEDCLGMDGTARILKPDWCYPGGRPKKGTIYLVDGLWWSPKVQRWGLQIAGLPCLNSHTGEPKGWNPNRFRKLVPACDRATMTEQAPTP